MTATRGPNYVIFFGPFNIVIALTSENSPEGVVPAPVDSFCFTRKGLFIKASGTDNAGWERFGRRFTVPILGVSIATSGSPADRASGVVPAGVTRWRPVRATVRCASATGTLAAGSAGLYTQTGGGGTELVPATALTPFTAANVVRDLSLGSPPTTVTDTTIYARQTVNSGNAGTLDVIVECQDLS